MLRTGIAALALSAIAGASSAGIIFPLCTDVVNGNFSTGSAFWSVDIETGEFGDTGTGVFTSFEPLSLLPNNGNVATFFTEAFAETDLDFHLGSSANSTVFFSRRVLSAPSGSVQFQYGGQLSFILTGAGRYSYSLQLVLRDIDTGREVRCKLASGQLENNSAAGTEGIVNIPVQTFNACNCRGAVGFPGVGRKVEIELIPSVRADAVKDDVAFIGGPFFFDNFRFCNILCPIPIDPTNPKIPAGGLIQQTPLDVDLSDLTREELRLFALDSNGDGVVDMGDVRPLINLSNLTPDLDADGEVSMEDVYLVLDAMGGYGDPKVNADLNGDGAVDEADLDIVMDARTR
ncbi:MAG: hypothetical protein AAGG07_10415 [Planctomycetota bacterium]